MDAYIEKIQVGTHSVEKYGERTTDVGKVEIPVPQTPPGFGWSKITLNKILQIVPRTPAPGKEAASNEQPALLVCYETVKTNLLYFAAA